MYSLLHTLVESTPSLGLSTWCKALKSTGRLADVPHLPLVQHPSASCNTTSYDEAVRKEARRLLPALSRSFFSASVNNEDKAAAEVRSLLDRAWLSSTSDLFDDPFKGVPDPNLGSGSALAAATSTASASSPDVAPSCSNAQVQIRPWHVAKDLLKMHVLACKVRRADRKPSFSWIAKVERM